MPDKACADLHPSTTSLPLLQQSTWQSTGEAVPCRAWGLWLQRDLAFSSDILTSRRRRETGRRFTPQSIGSRVWFLPRLVSFFSWCSNRSCHPVVTKKRNDGVTELEEWEKSRYFSPCHLECTLLGTLLEHSLRHQLSSAAWKLSSHEAVATKNNISLTFCC